MRYGPIRRGLPVLPLLLLLGGEAPAQTGPLLGDLLDRSAALAPRPGLDLGRAPAARYAVVIGNADYADIPDLPNARADAAAVADLLEAQGFEVHRHEDVTKLGFEDILRRLLFDVSKDTEVVVYYGGHGFQIGSENYLVPVDADLDSIYDVPFEAVSLGSLVNIVGARARLQIVMLDSCRDNPFAGRSAVVQIGNDLREVRTGFSSQAAPINSMLIFSTSPGSVAFDGAGPNSPFAASFLEVVGQEPEAPVSEVFGEVRRLVWERTGGRQVPWDSSTLVEPVRFGGATLAAPAPEGEEARGPTRALALLAEDPEADAAEPVAARPVVLSADLGPEVALGPALREALALDPAAEVTVVSSPRIGRLMVRPEGAAPRSLDGSSLAAGELEGLVLATGALQIPAASLPDGVVRDSFRLLADGLETEVAIELRPDPCDFEAGDQLDPDGMGITRYPNEIRPEIALEACQAAVAREPEVGRFHYQLGRALLALRRYDEAEAAFVRARDLGHARAWNALALARINAARRTGGLDRSEAPEEALELLARGVEAGDPYAYYSLGRQLMRFGDDEEAQIEGYDLMMRALEVGHTFAMNELAEFYLDEESPYYNPERGLRYLEESASRGDIYGYNNLGLVYWRGRGGTEPDPERAFDLFMKAAEGGHPTAPFNLARMYRDGDLGGRPDLRQAMDWFAVGLSRGDARAGANAAYLLMTQEVPGYDRFDAAVFAAKGAALGNPEDAAEAREQLAAMPEEVVNGGAQKLLVELGATVGVDGDWGQGSREAMDEVLGRAGAGPAEADPADRAVQLARLVWARSPFRVDLY